MFFYIKISYCKSIKVLNSIECYIFNFQNVLMSVSSQIPLLDEGIRIHGEKSTEQLKPLHNRLVTCFQDLRAKVEKLYGVITLVSLTDSTLQKGFVSDRQRVCSFLGGNVSDLSEVIHMGYCLTISLKSFESAKTTQG